MIKTFGDFIVDTSNQKAYNTCKAIAENKCCKPLVFIYAKSGLGKTHLLNSIINGCDSNVSVKRFTARELFDDFIDDIQFHKPIQFGKKCKVCDVILIDELEFLIGNDGIQLLLSRFLENALCENKRIVLSSEQTLNRLPSVRAFVVKHISSTAVCRIYKPTDELKRVYTRQLAARLELKMSKQAIEYIAQSFDRVVPIK